MKNFRLSDWSGPKIQKSDPNEKKFFSAELSFFFLFFKHFVIPANLVRIIETTALKWLETLTPKPAPCAKLARFQSVEKEFETNSRPMAKLARLSTQYNILSFTDGQF